MENTYTKRVYSALILLLLAGAFCLGFFTFYFYHKSVKEKPVTAVPLTDSLVLQTKPLTPKNIEFENEYIGYVTPIHEAYVQPYINGYIDKIFVQGGQYVKKGDTLLVLEQEQYKAALDAAYAQILKAKAALENAKVYFERTQKAKSSVSQTELDNANAQFLSAKATYQEAVANFEAAKVNFNYTLLNSPINGIVGDVSLTKGNYISPSGGALFSIVQLSPMRVRFSLTDKEYLQKAENNNFFDNKTIMLKLSNGQIFPNVGVFKYTDNTIDKSANSIDIYADFENVGKTLLPNAYVTVLVKEVFDNALKISKEYVMLDTTGVYVYIIRDGKIAKENLNILADNDTFFIVQNTFLPTDELIVQNVNSQDIGKNATSSNKESK